MDVSSNANTDDYPQYRDSNFSSAAYGLHAVSIHSFDQNVGHVHPHPMSYAPLMMDYSFMSYCRSRFLQNVTDQKYDHYL